MVQVQIRMQEQAVKELDKWVVKGRFKSRSDAIKNIVTFYGEREKTMEFYRMLISRSSEGRKKPEILIPIEDI